MSIRSLDWRDIPALHRYRKQGVFLDSALLLTRGSHMFAGSILSYLTPASGIFTSVSTNNGDTKHALIGQVIHPVGSQSAHLTFLAPEEALGSAALPELLDYLSVQSIEHGAFRLLAEIDERSPAYETLRTTSFSIYARQRVWRINASPSDQDLSPLWQVASDQDLIPVRSLYNNTVPGLVQQVEPFPVERLNGMVCRQGEDVLAYMELRYGSNGIFAQPFVDPDAERLVPRLLELLPHVPHRRSRPIYLCIRSYNSWMEPALEDFEAEVGPRQAVMVKHLAVPQKVVRSFALPALEGGHPEITAPISQTQPVQTRLAQKENNGYLCHNER
jgi:hypothetical protein